MSSPKVWFITGCSSGFGLNLALIALKAGHKVIATSRTPSKTPDLVSQVESLGGVWHTLDICSPEAELQLALEKACSVYGHIDILVNNAGYALLGAFETISNAEAHSIMETNFFAPMTLTRLLLPSMRTRRSGTIVNISSAAGIQAKASRSLYSASKFALEAFSESLSHEVKPFDIRVLIVEPGAFRSSFAANLNMPEMEMPDDYKGTETDMMIEFVKNMTGEQREGMPGDVEKGARAIFEVATRTGKGKGLEDLLRLPLGRDGVEASWLPKIKEMEDTLERTEKVWNSTDADP